MKLSFFAFLVLVASPLFALAGERCVGPPAGVGDEHLKSAIQKVNAVTLIAINDAIDRRTASAIKFPQNGCTRPSPILLHQSARLAIGYLPAVPTSAGYHRQGFLFTYLRYRF